MDTSRIPFPSFEELKKAVLESKKGLHQIVEKRLAGMFRELYPGAFVKMESNFAVKGRTDMVVHLKDKTIHVELIASKEMVNRDVRLLVRSLCDFQIVILMDDEIDDKVAYEYHDELHSRNLPPDHFPRFKLSDVLLSEKEEDFKRNLREILRPVQFPLPPDLHNQTPPEPNFAGRTNLLQMVTEWYKSKNIRIAALIGWGGVGKSALVREWYDSLEENNIHPDGIFWWGFYRNAYLEPFLNALLKYVSQGEADPDTIKSTWDKTEKIKEHIQQRAFLIILDGLDQIQETESGDQLGKMRYRECSEFLHYLAVAPKAGFCMIITRYPLRDLENWRGRSYDIMRLTNLTMPDALAMLRKRGVRGQEHALSQVAERYKGHALSLTSVAGYLNRYHDGDINQAPDIEFVFGDKERFKDVKKLLNKYAEKMSETEIAFLNIFSLFRTEVAENEFAGVFRRKIEGTDFNRELVKMTDPVFKDIVNSLVDWRLISYDGEKKSFTSHPLLRAYFESTFDEKDKKVFHQRIYRYFGEQAAKQPESLEEMQPLFEQVHHGCAAGLHDEAYHDVYWKRICRRNAYFLTANLGAWETELSVIRNFFPKYDLSNMPLVTKRRYQTALLNSAGLDLLNIGAPKEAQELLTRKTEMQIEDRDWRNASVGRQILCDLQFRIGEIGKALRSAKAALELAERDQFREHIMLSASYLAYVLHLSGASNEASEYFAYAGRLAKRLASVGLQSLVGILYADFLTSIGALDDALELTTQNLNTCQRSNWPADVSRCQRCLAAIGRIKGDYVGPQGRLREALELARTVGMPELQIEVLLEYGRLHLAERKYDEAMNAANRVLKLCERTDFLLYEPDADVILGKACLAQKNFEEAKKFANSARSKAKKMGYKLAENDAAELLKEIGSKRK